MLLGNTLRYLPTQLLSPIAQLGSMVLWTHWLSPADLAVFMQVTAAQELAYLASIGWFSSYALRHLPDRSDSAARLRYLRTENMVMLAAVAVGCACAVVAWLTLPSGPAQAGLLLAIAAMFVTRSAGQHYAERARAQSAFVAYGVLQLAGPVGGLVLGWWAMSRLGPSPVLLLTAYAVAQGAGVLLAAPALGMTRQLGRPNTDILRAAVALGAPMLTLAASAWLGENQIRYTVQWARDAEALGLLILGWSLGRRCATVAATLVTTAAFPLAARLYNEGRRSEALVQLRLSALMLMAVLLPVTTMVALIGGQLLEPLVGAKYRGLSGDLMALAMVGGAVRNLLIHVIDQLMILEKRWRLMIWMDAAELLAGVLLTWAGLMLAEQRGAVIGQGLSGLLMLAVGIRLCRKYFGFAWPWADTARVLLACAAMAVVLLVWKPQVQGTVALLLSATAGVAAAGAVLAALFAPKWWPKSWPLWWHFWRRKGE